MSRLPAGSRRAIVLLGLSLLLPAPAAASNQARADGRSSASPYLSLDHWAYPALDLWIARGDIIDLSPMTRPYRVADVRRAVSSMARRGLTGAELGIRERLLEELADDVPGAGGKRSGRPSGRSGAAAPPRDGVERSPADLLLTAGIDAGGRYVPQTHPDPLQPVLDGRFGEDRVLEQAELTMRVSSPVAAAGVRMRRDGIYRHDPRFPDGRVVPERDLPVFDELSIRASEAYVELQVPYFRLSLGRLDRNWGPAAVDGFLRSSNPYGQDEIGYRLGTDRLFLIGSISAPDDFSGDTVRHLSMHRLEFRPTDRLALAVSEAVIHGGPNGRFRFALANPVGIWQIAVDDTEVAHNKVGQLDAWWRLSNGVTVNGSLLADATNQEGSCCQLGGTFGLELTRLLPGVRLGGQLTAIQSLAYRTERPWEEYSVDGVGLGWDKSDLLLFSLEADWLATADLIFRPRFDVQRIGEGDFRQPRPPASELPDQDPLLSGVVETTLRPAIGGRWRTRGAWQVAAEWDLGLSVIADYAHVEGDDRTAFTGSVGLRLFTPRLAFRLP